MWFCPAQSQSRLGMTILIGDLTCAIFCGVCMKSEMEESRLPGQIVEEEEVERLKSLELREILLRKLGVVDFIYSLLIPPPGPKKVFFPPCHRLVGTSHSTADSQGCLSFDIFHEGFLQCNYRVVY